MLLIYKFAEVYVCTQDPCVCCSFVLSKLFVAPAGRRYATRYGLLVKSILRDAGGACQLPKQCCTVGFIYHGPSPFSRSGTCNFSTAVISL